MSSDVIARLVDELDGITDADEAINPARLDSYHGGLAGIAWDLGIARHAALRADIPSRRRVAERDCAEAAVRLDAFGLHAEAATVRAWPQALGRGRCEP